MSRSRRISSRQSTHAMRSFMGTVCAMYAFNYNTCVIEADSGGRADHLAMVMTGCTAKCITFTVDNRWSNLMTGSGGAMVAFFLTKGYKCTMQGHTCTVYWQ